MASDRSIRRLDSDVLGWVAFRRCSSQTCPKGERKSPIDRVHIGGAAAQGVTEGKVTVSSWDGEIWELYLTIGTRIGEVP